MSKKISPELDQILQRGYNRPPNGEYPDKPKPSAAPPPPKYATRLENGAFDDVNRGGQDE